MTRRVRADGVAYREAMICPKCQNAMRTFDKNGVHIDQCESCHGIFLDRGELEQIVSAESNFYSGSPAPPPYQPEPSGHDHGQGEHVGPGHEDSPRPYRGSPDSPRPYRGGHEDSPRPYRGGYADSPRPYGEHRGCGRRRESFLEQLFG